MNAAVAVANASAAAVRVVGACFFPMFWFEEGEGEAGTEWHGSSLYELKEMAHRYSKRISLDGPASKAMVLYMMAIVPLGMG